MPDYQQLQPLSERTKVTLNLASIGALCITVVSATFFATNWFNDFLAKWQDSNRDLAAKIASATTDRWTGTDMVSFARELRDKNWNLAHINGDTERGITVPDAREIHRENSTN